MVKTPWQTADQTGSEFAHQTALFQWAAMARMFGANVANEPQSYQVAGYAKKFFDHYQVGAAPLAPNVARLHEPIPELKWLHAIKNQGHGDRVRGARSAMEGVRTGVFDIFLPSLKFDAPFKGGIKDEYEQIFAGLYIELKTPDRKNHKNGGASDKQLEFQADMREAGYAAEIAHGWTEARDMILRYLGRT